MSSTLSISHAINFQTEREAEGCERKGIDCSCPFLDASSLLFFVQVKASQMAGELLGFVHFRFSLEGEVVDAVEGSPTLMLYELNFQKDVSLNFLGPLQTVIWRFSFQVQRNGLGKFLMMLLELIAKKHQMKCLTVPVVKGNTCAQDFFTKAIKGFSVHKKYGEDEVQVILSKSLVKQEKQVSRLPPAKEAKDLKNAVEEKKPTELVA